MGMKVSWILVFLASGCHSLSLVTESSPWQCKLEPWGADSLRVRCNSAGPVQDKPGHGALADAPGFDNKGWPTRADTTGGPVITDNTVINGNIIGAVDPASGLVTITRKSDGLAILSEMSKLTNATSTTVSFKSTPDEMIFGFGEHQQGLLNNKGAAYDMESCLEYGKSSGGEVCLPFVLGATAGAVRYGLLWNMPNYGGVDFGSTDSGLTSWTAQSTSQIDYFITIGSAAQIMHAYVDAVGHSPVLPEFAAGYWHSKNRYTSQEKLLAAAAEFHERSINVSVIVVDYNHWRYMGDWSFDPVAWPDVPGMMKTLDSYGMKLMVSAWPFSAVNSSSYEQLSAQGLAVTDQSSVNSAFWNDNNCADGVYPSPGRPCLLYDPTQQSAREFVWGKLQQGYYQHGIKVFWLDASEPEISTADAQKSADYYNNSIGTGQEVGMMFPYWHTRMVHDGLVSQGETDIVMLTRSAWAGMQRFGAALWSGDTQSNWASLQVSIQAGLNTQLSGISWWTTDIGGYSGGDPTSADFRQLIVRWFQFGMTCPLFRQHGARDTEPWGYGNASLAAIEGVIRLRESFQPYIMEQMKSVASTGLPVNRPLWFDFPDDPNVWSINDSYMFGSEYIVCPVTAPNATSWPCYLPVLTGEQHVWAHQFTGKLYHGGQNVSTATPLDQFPLFYIKAIP